MKNIQIIDGAENATYSVFQATDEEFCLIFPRDGQDLEIAEVMAKRIGAKKCAQLFKNIWTRPILKSEVNGIHGTLFYGYYEKRHNLPRSKREIDRAESQMNQAQRHLYKAARGALAKSPTR